MGSGKSGLSNTFFNFITMDHVTIKATKRTVGNKQSIKQLRRNGEVPCVLYGHDTENTVFSVKTKDLRVVTHTPNSYIIDLDLDGQIKECIFHDIQFHPVTDEILHMDFLSVSEKKPVTIEVPVIVSGNAEGVKLGGKLSVVARKLKISAMMDKLPGHINVDVTPLGIGHSITAGDIVLEGVQVVAPKNYVICSVNVTRQVAVTETVEAAPADVAPDAPAATEEKK
jgi:large subunit ribosomal protein L25